MPCFNGAALFQVRIRCRGPRHRGPLRCFNGAALFQVRIMRPQVVDRKTKTMLQWGRTFSSADKHPWTGSSFDFFQLQWGRTFSSADNPSGQANRDRLLDSFNGAALFQVRIRREWEVPRHLERRFNGAALFQVRINSIQLAGRRKRKGFNGAALFQVRITAEIDNGDVVEDRFNGAALFQVRIIGGEKTNKNNLQSLQWGRTFSSADNPQWGTGSAPDRSRFNGAALFQVRIRAVFGFGECHTSGLQWGRTFSSADNKDKQDDILRPSWASMGPHFFKCG